MSKLDQAFLKAYAKVRGTGTSGNGGRRDANGHPIASEDGQLNRAIEETEIWSDADGPRLVRPDEGVMNVASFIARTSGGRTRGTSQRPDQATPMAEPSGGPDEPAWFAEPERESRLDNVGRDPGHALKGPHFQPISLDLAALDIFAPSAVLATASFVAEVNSNRRSSIEISHDEFQPLTMPQIGAAPTDAPQYDAPQYDAPQYNAAAVAASSATMHSPVAQLWEASPQNVAPMDTQASVPIAVATAQLASRVMPQSRPSDARPQTNSPARESSPSREIGGGSFVRSDEAHPISTATTSVTSDVIDEVADDMIDEMAEIEVHQEAAVEPEVAEVISPATTTESFAAAWEVDRFEFEEIIWELCAETSPLWQAAEQLELACREGLKVLAITSPARGQGRSTLSITMARMLAATGLNVALIDGDLDKPSLADKMRLEIRLGWGDAVRTGISAEEVAVQSVEDGFTVLPLAVPDASKGVRPAADAASKMIAQLRGAFDVVVIDSANINVIGGWIPGADAPCQIDAALVIKDLRREDPEAMQACLRRLHKLGIANIGLVENFSGE